MKYKNGFTLVETVIAIGVAMFGLLSILSLNTSSLLVTESSEYEFLATQFAREGIETVRAIRDSNWLKYETDSTTAWNAGLVSGTDYTAILQNPVTSTYLDFTTNSISQTCTGASSSTYTCASIWYDTAQLYYYQTNSTLFNPSGATVRSTSFKRIIDLNSTDNTERVITTGSCLGTETQVGIAAVSQVEYPARTTTATYTLEEYLYDWKY
jgi:Tfp pilus assembly protein PilV